MSRFRRLIHSVLSGYATLGVSTVYALASIPLALHYLSKEQFALWVLMSSIGNYLSLVDLGMAGSVARLLIDHKDDRGGGNYGSLIKTGACVTVAQGALVALGGFLIAPILAGLLNIDVDLRDDFIALLRLQVAGLGLAFATKIFGHVLTAHQRMDIPNYSQIGGLVVNFSVQWFLFHADMGVFSLAWGLIAGVFFNATIALIACARLQLFPQSGTWGHASLRYFQELFAYGKDLFLVSLGTQLIMASQTMIITRRVGLEAAAVWGVGTKAFSMVYQLISRIIAFSMPAFSEMIVRGEQTKLRDRFKEVVILSASCAAYAAVVFAVCNGTLMHLLSHGKIGWPPQNDVLLGVWLLVLAVLGCHNNLVLGTKQVGMMRFIYFIEGSVFVAVAWVTSAWGGLPAIIISSISCSALFTCGYGIWRTSRYFGLPIWEISFGWLVPMWRVILFFAPVGLLTWLAMQSLGGHDVQDTSRVHDFFRLVIAGAVSGTIGVAILISQGLPASLRRELLARFLARSSKPVIGFFQRLFNYR